MIVRDKGDQAGGDQVAAGAVQPDMTQAAIDRFHQTLREQAVAEATWRWLMREQCALGLEVQGRLLAQVLRPRLISVAAAGRVCLA